MTSITEVNTCIGIIEQNNLTQYDGTKVTHATVKKGSKGEIVKELQTLLIGKGYSCGKSGADGIFGSATDEAVKAYQAENDLTVDGIVGSKTWEKLLS